MRRSERMTWAAGLLAAALLAGGAGARAQVADAALRDRVDQLVERLDDPGDAAEKAEKALIGLGPKALPLLPEPAKSGKSGRDERLARVRKALVEAQDNVG